MADDWKRAGAFIATQRRICGFKTQEDFGAAVDVSKSTIGNLENGRRASYAPGFLELVEDALSWVQGSIMRTVEGGKPIPRPDPYLARIQALWPKLPVQAKKAVVEVVEAALRPD